MMVLAASKRNPSWAYTIGFTEHYDHPEVVASNVDPAYLNQLADVIREGFHFEDGSRIEGLLRDPVVFRRVPPELHGPEVAACTRHYGARPFELLQMVWPDHTGKFPWDKGYSNVVPQHQLWRRGGPRGHGRLIPSPSEPVSRRTPGRPLYAPQALTDARALLDRERTPTSANAAGGAGTSPPTCGPRSRLTGPLETGNARATLERDGLSTALRWDRRPFVDGVH